MKTKKLGLFGLLTVSAFGLTAVASNSVHSLAVRAEEGIEEEPAVYVLTEEDSTSTLTLLTESTFSLVGVKGDSEVSFKGTYTREGDVLSLSYLDSTIDVKISEDGTFSNCEKTEEEEKPEHSLTEEEKEELLKNVLGEEIYEQFIKALGGEKDWTEVFTLGNVLKLITTVLNGGLLIAIVRYFVKDKKMAKTIEAAVKTTVAKLVPEQTQAAVAAAMETAISPLFTKFVQTSKDTSEAVKTLSKCFVLAQEGTPESRIAIVNELSKINVDDNNLVGEVKDFIVQATEKLKAEMDAKLASLNVIQEANEKIINEETEKEEKSEVVNTDDGTSW